MACNLALRRKGRKPNEIPLLFIPHDPFQSGCPFIATVEEQLLDKFLFQLQSVSFSQVHFNEVCVTEGVVGGSPLCLIILVRQVLPQSLHPSVWLLGSRPLASRLICIVDFSHTSICESFCLDRSGRRHQRLGVGTVQSIVSTQLPSSTLAVSAHPHIHGVAGRVET